MTSSAFADALMAQAPSLPELEQLDPGSDPEEREAIRNQFIAHERGRPGPLARVTGTELDSLLRRYDLSRVAVLGDIQFYPEPFANDAWAAKEQALAFASGGGGMFSVDAAGAVWWNDEEESWRCARTVGDFFRALVELQAYYRRRRLQQVARKDVGARQVHAEQAARAAGEAGAVTKYLDLINEACPL